MKANSDDVKKPINENDLQWRNTNNEETLLANEKFS